jgi:hypothetical protein
MTEENYVRASEINNFQSNFEKRRFPKNNLQNLPTDPSCNLWANGNLTDKGNV